MPKVCVLGRWSPQHLFIISSMPFRQDPFTRYWGRLEKGLGTGQRRQLGSSLGQTQEEGALPKQDGSGNPKPTGSPELLTLYPESGPRRGLL